MVGTPRDMTLIIAGFFAQNLPAKAVELMSNGFLLGWCQLQELLIMYNKLRKLENA